MDAGRKVASTCGGFGRRSGSRVHTYGWTWNLPGQNGRHWRRFSRLDRWGRPHQRLSGSPRPRKLCPAREVSSFQTADTLNREMQGRRRESTTRVCLPSKTCPCERATAEPGARRSLSHRRAAAAAPGFGSGRRGGSNSGSSSSTSGNPRFQDWTGVAPRFGESVLDVVIDRARGRLRANLAGSNESVGQAANVGASPFGELDVIHAAACMK